MTTIQTLEASRKQAETRLLMFPNWFVKSEWEVDEHLVGSTMCKVKGLTIDWFLSISNINFEKCQIKNQWVFQCLANSDKGTKIITLIKK